MPSFKDLTGTRFGQLIVLSWQDTDRHGNHRWLCQCDCGVTKVVNSRELRIGDTRSCGCIRREKTGIKPDRRYGLLVVEKYFGLNQVGAATWMCRCDCGRNRIVESRLLTHGKMPSCGCYRRPAHYRTPEYATWRYMIMRCENKGINDYHLYGGRDIKVCDKWRQDFHAFVADVGKKPGKHYTLDRIDSDGNYEPGNVRWATWKEQASNRRNTPRVAYQGETHTLKEWAELKGLNYITLFWRWQQGWLGDKLFRLPK